MAAPLTPVREASNKVEEGYDDIALRSPTRQGLRARFPKQAADDIYTLDGTVDLKGRPSVRSKTGGWRACPFILGNECCERLAYYGISTNLVVYLTKVLHQKNAKAATNVTNWSGTCYITPLIGGFFADAFLGRYWTIALFSTIYCIGMVLLTLSASLPSLKPPRCSGSDGSMCPEASGIQLGIFYLSLYLVALGTGGIKPCVSSFGADQFDDNHEGEMKKKSSFFNWFYFSINIGALISSSLIVYVQNNVSWGWGFGIPAATMGIAIISFFIGTFLYRHQKPSGSPLTRIFQVLVAALRKWNIRVPSDELQLYEVDEKSSVIEGSRKLQHTPAFRLLDKAATPGNNDMVNLSNVKINQWKLVTVTQVEEVKLLWRLMPIWATSIVFSTVYSQMSTLFVEQGGVMNRKMAPHFTIGAATMNIFDTISVLIWVPIYDRLLVPYARRWTGDVRGFSQLTRMGIGLVVSVLAMVCAAVVEIERLKTAKRHNLLDSPDAQVPMSVFWQIPQYFFVGAAEVFMFIGQLEFFYDQSPDAMRSLGSALSLTTVALGNYLSSLLVTIVTSITTRHGHLGWIPENLNRGHLDYFYWLLAVLSVLNFFAYLVCARWYKYKQVEDFAEDIDLEEEDKGEKGY